MSIRQRGGEMVWSRRLVLRKAGEQGAESREQGAGSRKFEAREHRFAMEQGAGGLLIVNVL